MIVPLSAGQAEGEFSAPASKGEPFLVLLHPHPRLGGTMHNKVIDQLFRRSRERGWGAFRFNFRGVEKSSGSFDRGEGETDDTVEILSWLGREQGVPTGSVTLVGYSFGAWIAARVASQRPLERLVLVAPPVTVQKEWPLDRVTCPKLVYWAENDEFAPGEVFLPWFESLAEPKRLLRIEGADHYFVGRTRELVQNILAALEEKRP